MLNKLPPPLLALLTQAAAWLVTLGCALLAHQLGYAVTLLPLALLCGVLAALWSRLLRLPTWWLPIQLLFAPALLLTLQAEVSPHWFLAAFILLLAVYWSTFKTQVPLYLSNRAAWQALETLLPATGQHFTFVDLGSGLGGVLLHLAKARPDGRYHGVETAPLPCLLSWLRIRLGKHRNCTVHWGNFWDCDLAQYDVVFAFLSPVPMAALWRKAKSEMKPGALFISNTFAVPDQPPQQTLPLNDLRGSALYVWRM
jgi:hypothetical protein